MHRTAFLMLHSSMSVSRFPPSLRKLGFLEFIRIHSPVSTILRDSDCNVVYFFYLLLRASKNERRELIESYGVYVERGPSNPRSCPPAFLYNRNQLIDPPSVCLLLHATTRNNYAFPDDALTLAGAVTRKRKERPQSAGIPSLLK